MGEKRGTRRMGEEVGQARMGEEVGQAEKVMERDGREERDGPEQQEKWVGVTGEAGGWRRKIEQDGKSLAMQEKEGRRGLRRVACAARPGTAANHASP
jgi:hypothetical protein